MGDILFHPNFYWSVGLLACHITGTAEKGYVNEHQWNQKSNFLVNDFEPWFSWIDQNHWKPTISIWWDDEGWSSRLQAATTVLIHRRMPSLRHSSPCWARSRRLTNGWVIGLIGTGQSMVFLCCFTGQPRPTNDTLQRRHSKSEIWLSPHATEFVKRSWIVHSFSGSEMDLDHES